jgi:hypothetical protein
MSCVGFGALAAGSAAPVGEARAAESPTATPIKHVIIIIGENRTFDHVFATYQPVNKDTVLNLRRAQFAGDVFLSIVIELVVLTGSPGMRRLSY